MVSPVGPHLQRLPWEASLAAHCARKAAASRHSTEDDELADHPADWLILAYLPDYKPQDPLFVRLRGVRYIAAAHADLEHLVRASWREFGAHRACRWVPIQMADDDVDDLAYWVDACARGAP